MTLFAPRGGGERDGASEPDGASERGSVTVEAAVALSALVVVLALCLAGIAAMLAQLQAEDAAGEAARLAARGDGAAAQAAVERLAPAGSVLTLSGQDLVTARVVAPPLGSLLPGIRIGATAFAAREPEIVMRSSP